MNLKEKLWTCNEVRRQFIEYFQSLDHEFYKSSPVIPLNDPTILFINAGMNQFKSIFSGTVEPNSELSKLVRVANSQKCIRAGGKHNDLDDVGKDVYHHTFFEMLGSWSFGDYFKEEAISWAYKLLTQVYGIPSDRLYVTYFGGDPKLPTCPVDEEAKKIWLKYLPEERVISCGSKENFWEMAETGPCGPCSEIHYDRIGNRNASSLVNKDDPNVIEVWNLVFMQYYREHDGSLTPLPRKCVDTGLGLERLVSILQNKSSNYDTDLFEPIFTQIHEVIGNIPQYSGKVGLKDDPLMIDMSYRVIADHIRTLTVAIADGCFPSNEGRGYVLRRILRRAVRYGSQYLKAGTTGEPWFYKLVDSVSEVIGCYYKEIPENIKMIKDVILDEEKQFSKTLFKGTERFNKVINKLLSSSSEESKSKKMVFPANEAFQLYSTYGFPMDLTEIMAKEKNFDFDHQGFQICMENHHLASEGKNNKTFDNLILKPDIQNSLLCEYNLKETNDIFKYENNLDLSAKLIAIFNGIELLTNMESQGNTVGLIFDKTTFYSESGGQVGDTGYIDLFYENVNSKFQVIDCKKYGNYVLHIGILLNGKVNVDDKLKCQLFVDYSRRNLIRKNHTATHLLNFALRQKIGDLCDQKGSVVDPNRLRFDFASQKALTNEQIESVEKMVNDFIQKKLNVYCQSIQLSLARQIPNVRAIFGETYPDPVRVLSVGVLPKEFLSENPQQLTSIEFCGGTHVDNTADIISFTIISEEGIAKGVRRILAVTDRQSEIAVENAKNIEHELSKLINLNGKELESHINIYKAKLEETKLIPLIKKKHLARIIEENYKRVLSEAKKKQKERLNMVKELSIKIEQDYQVSDELNGIILNVAQIQGDSKSMDILAQDLSKKFTDKPIMLFTSGEYNDHGISAISIVPKSMSSLLSSTNWLKSTLELCGGKCGGNEVRSVGSSKTGAEKIQSMIEVASSLLNS